MITLLFLLIAAGAKAVMDCSSEGALKWKPANYWIKDLSWYRKWKPRALTQNGSTIIADANKEAFPFSSTLLVSLTDGWHLAQAIFLLCMFLSIVSYKAKFLYAIDFLIMRVWFGVSFEMLYRALKK